MLPPEYEQGRAIMDRLTPEQMVALEDKGSPIMDFDFIYSYATMMAADNPISPPNLREFEPMLLWGRLFAHYYKYLHRYVYINGDFTRAQLFIDFDEGRGFVVTYLEKVYEFAICRHEKVLRPAEPPDINWFPGICRLCGLNMDGRF